tara:strand:+ start:10 stop:1017 length:1008 start_codon:yes stop_codon:yes gene_type:complete
MDFNNIKTSIESNFDNINTTNFFNGTKDFLTSNSLLAKATFLLLMIIIFFYLTKLSFFLIKYFFGPDPTPYLVKGLKNARSSMIISQTLADKNAIPVMRSNNEYSGVELTYNWWMFINEYPHAANNNNNVTYSHVFNKGSITPKNTSDTYSCFNNDNDNKEIKGPNNAPGVYLYNGKSSVSKYFSPNSGSTTKNCIDVSDNMVGMMILIDTTNNTNPGQKEIETEYIFIDNLPLKKWINCVIRVTSQNKVDVYINGVAMSSYKLRGVIMQNYDSFNVNLSRGFEGYLSNIKYYNYAIGTFEIDSVLHAGPNLKTNEKSNFKFGVPSYLSQNWFYD